MKNTAKTNSAIFKLFLAVFFSLSGANSANSSAMNYFQYTLNKPTVNGTLSDLYGKTQLINDYKGKIIVLTLWDKGCNYSINQLVYLNKLAKYFSHDIDNDESIIFISAMRKSAMPEIPSIRGWSAARIFKKLKVYSLYNCKADKILEHFCYKISKKQATPITLIIDRNLRCIGCFKGFASLDKADVAQFIQKILDNKLKTRRKKTWHSKITKYFKKIWEYFD